MVCLQPQVKVWHRKDSTECSLKGSVCMREFLEGLKSLDEADPGAGPLSKRDTWDSNMLIKKLVSIALGGRLSSYTHKGMDSSRKTNPPNCLLPHPCV